MLRGAGHRLTPSPPPLFTVRIPIKGGCCVGGGSLKVGGKSSRESNCSQLKLTLEVGGLSVNWEVRRGGAVGVASPSPFPYRPPTPPSPAPSQEPCRSSQ